MSYFRRLALRTWLALLLPVIVSLAVLVVLSASRPEVASVVAIPVAALLLAEVGVLLAMTWTTGRLARSVVSGLEGPGEVAFAARRTPGAMEHLDVFLVPSARGGPRRLHGVRADDRGITFWADGSDRDPFVDIPWPSIGSMEAGIGAVVVKLVDGGDLYLYPWSRALLDQRFVEEVVRKIASVRSRYAP